MVLYGNLAFFPSFGICLGSRIHACDKWVECSPKNDLNKREKANAILTSNSLTTNF
jgi:hypothetical protein